MPKKILWAAVIACVFLLPFFSSDVFRAQTYFLYALLTVSLFGIAVMNRSWMKNRAIILPLSLWLFIVFFTSLYALYAPGAFTAFCHMLVFVIIFMASSGLEDKRKRQLAFTLVVGSILVSVRAILQYFIFFDKIVPLMQARWTGLSEKEILYITDIALRHRTISTFVTSNLLASYLSMVNIIAMLFCVIDENKLFRVVSLFALALNCYSLWLTRSAAALASLAIGIFLMSLFLSAKRQPRAARLKKIFTIFCVGASTAFVCLFINRAAHDMGTDRLFLSLTGRLEFWKTAIRIVSDQPLQFVGLGGFGFLYRLYAPYAQFESTMAHNLFLQLWIETGIVATLVFVWFIWAIIWSGIKGLNRLLPDLDNYAFKAACLCAAAVFLIHNMLDFSFFVPQTAVIFWLLCSFFTSNDNNGKGIGP